MNYASSPALKTCATVFLLVAFLAVIPARHATAFEPEAVGAALHAAIVAPRPEMEKLALPDGELDRFYASRNYTPAWNFADGPNNPALLANLDSLEKLVAYHGLRQDMYPFAYLRQIAAEPKDDRNRPLMELLLTGSLLRLAHDVHGDRVDLGDAYPGWVFRRNKIDIPFLLATAIASGDVNDLMKGLAPANPAYARLAAALQSYRDIAEKGGWKAIAAGPALRPRDRGPRVLQLRARLAAEDYLPQNQPQSNLFDGELGKAVTAYQLRNGLEPNGQVGGKTLEALNTPLADRIGQIRANMERWRQMPEDFPPQRYAEVNIADAGLLIVEGGKDIYRGPVVVGKVDRKTPFIESRIRSMIINPYWHVPAKIARKDILPKLRKDPHYLEKLGFVISGDEADPHGDTVDWAQIKEREFNFRLRQSPGDQNSLGHLKFDFDNDFAVYMHGTPHQELFGKTQRDFSSGCIRLRDPDVIGEILMKDNEGGWDAAKIEAEIAAGKTRWIGIANPMPLYVLYWSVFPDEETGAINFRKDVYDYDRVMAD